MVRALVTESAVAAVREALGAEADVREVAAGGGVDALRAAAGLPAEALVLDVATGPGLGSALVRYRLARPQTRVVILALGRSPGDADVAALVAAGVYDICTDVAGLPAVLARQAGTLTHAVAWLPRGLSPDAPEGKVRTVERVVERERIVQAPSTAHAVRVVVRGVCGGAGATTVATSLAGALARAGRYRVLLAGPEGDCSLALGLSGRSRVGAVDVLGPDDDREAASRQRAWHYVVEDAGTAPAGRDADLEVRVAPGAWHRAGHLRAGLRGEAARDGVAWVVAWDPTRLPAAELAALAEGTDWPRLHLWPSVQGATLEELLAVSLPAVNRATRALLGPLLPTGRG